MIRDVILNGSEIAKNVFYNFRFILNQFPKVGDDYSRDYF